MFKYSKDLYLECRKFLFDNFRGPSPQNKISGQDFVKFQDIIFADESFKCFASRVYNQYYFFITGIYNIII